MVSYGDLTCPFPKDIFFFDKSEHNRFGLLIFYS